MGGERPDRDARQRRRVRELMQERRRALITEIKSLDAFLAQEEADDEGAVAVLPGDAQRLPRSGNRPPAGMHR